MTSRNAWGDITRGLVPVTDGKRVDFEATSPETIAKYIGGLIWKSCEGLTPTRKVAAATVAHAMYEAILQDLEER